MRPSRPPLLLISPRLFLLMSLMFLAGLDGCGPAPSDNPATIGPRARLTDPPLSQTDPPPRTDLLASASGSAAASPAPLASENRTGSVPARRTVPAGDSPKAAPASATKPVNLMDALEAPAWFAKDLAAPDIDTRLRALETWVLIAPVGSIDPLILAFGNDDERVQARAMELIKQDMVRVAEAGE